MKASKIALIFFLISLSSSIFFTFVPLIRGREGGCPIKSVPITSGSVVYELVRTGGKWEYLEPATRINVSPGITEYGCSIDERNRVVPVDLYAFTLLSGIAAIVLSERKRVIKEPKNG